MDSSGIAIRAHHVAQRQTKRTVEKPGAESETHWRERAQQDTSCLMNLMKEKEKRKMRNKSGKQGKTTSINNDER